MQKWIDYNMLPQQEKQLQAHMLMTVLLQCHLCTQGHNIHNREHLQDTYCVQGTELSTLFTSSHLIIIPALYMVK